MKKRAVLVTIAVSLSLLFLGGQVMAGPSVPLLNWGSELNPGQCPDGQLVINVTHKVTNDLDSGVAGNWWAYDNYNKHIQVWEVDTDIFCAVVHYQGSFTTVAGRSPNDTDDIAEGIKGAFQGGYRATITGTLDPQYQTKGNIGKFDYGCDADEDPGDRSTCCGLFNWVDAYFSDWTFSYDWWGWIYHGGKNGTWVNSSDGNQGDITD